MDFAGPRRLYQHPPPLRTPTVTGPSSRALPLLSRDSPGGQAGTGGTEAARIDEHVHVTSVSRDGVEGYSAADPPPRGGSSREARSPCRLELGSGDGKALPLYTR
ncbi:hypothetical protein NDU88_011931, partial [Pleurodeles waltl]